MNRLYLHKFVAILLFASFAAGINANGNAVLDFGALSNPQISKQVGQMLATPIVNAIEEKNPESPFLGIPFGDLISAGLQWIGELAADGASNRQELRTTERPVVERESFVTRREPLRSFHLNMPGSVYPERGVNQMPAYPPYPHGYFDQYGVFRPFQPIYNGPVDNQQGPSDYIPAPFNQNQQKRTNNANPQTSPQYPNAAGTQNRPIAPENRIPYQHSDPATLDGRRNALDNPSTRNIHLPDDHDFASPVDVDTTGKGSQTSDELAPLKPSNGSNDPSPLQRTTELPFNEDPYAKLHEQLQGSQQTTVSNVNSGRGLPQMPAYPTYFYGYIDQYGVFRPLQPVYNGPVGNQQGPSDYIPAPFNQDQQKRTNNANPQSSPHYPNAAGRQNRPIAPENRMPYQHSDPASLDGRRNALDNPSTRNIHLPDDHNFASPVDVVTTGEGSPTLAAPKPSNGSNDSSPLQSTTELPVHEDSYAKLHVQHQGSQQITESNANSGQGPPQISGYYDQFRVFRPFPVVQNAPAPYADTQQRPSDINPVRFDQNQQYGTDTAIPRNPQQNPIAARGQNGPVNVANMGSTVPNWGDISSDNVINILNQPSPNNLNLPDNHDFASPVDVDTTGYGNPTPSLPPVHENQNNGVLK